MDRCRAPYIAKCICDMSRSLQSSSPNMSRVTTDLGMNCSTSWAMKPIWFLSPPVGTMLSHVNLFRGNDRTRFSHTIELARVISFLRRRSEVAVHDPPPGLKAFTPVIETSPFENKENTWPLFTIITWLDLLSIVVFCPNMDKFV
ncbi:hypothetical protein ATCV1_z493R [Acanthocystis turfacea chlorella virus 1]|uniref:Uncharacterized protein z493R n=1 Tax=Chlorovirus heliozoae TaxID=322019 RepID=A7K9A3_9PHYC|nr:hypothetical protein ATCV1_z493R [Acanthocystis turfacea chlorella virus 1]ABT16627.1 hypothetical protein ATCV1_z493R [Acanthocystis turfacea chlorella virus 1]